MRSAQKSKGKKILAADIRASFREALALAAGKQTKAKMHRVAPRKMQRAVSKQAP